MNHEWARELRDQCVEQGVAFFFKQSASYRSESGKYLIEADGSKAEWREYPGNLQAPIQEAFPDTAARQMEMAL